jgi:hypothetical protein
MPAVKFSPVLEAVVANVNWEEQQPRRGQAGISEHEVTEILKAHDRMIEESLHDPRDDQDQVMPSLGAIFADVEEAAKGAHAPRTRDAYKS